MIQVFFIKEISFCQLMIRYDSYHRRPSKRWIPEWNILTDEFFFDDTFKVGNQISK